MALHGAQKTTIRPLQEGRQNITIFSFFQTLYRHWTDKQTDGRTALHVAPCMLTHNKNALSSKRYEIAYYVCFGMAISICYWAKYLRGRTTLSSKSQNAIFFIPASSTLKYSLCSRRAKCPPVNCPLGQMPPFTDQPG